MFKKYINNQKTNIIGSVCDLITFPSISEESNNSHFPFGRPCSEALKYFLHLADSLGFTTKNVDGYCGWAEFGEGKDLIGIIGHLDVVPANEKDFTYFPFTPTISNNRIYGRGAIDDKGPVISCLYAMKSVMDYYKENNITFNKRVRLIVGLNEEKDWKCINYYKEHEEIPSIGFSPDGDFPCIYAEKGILSLNISYPLSSFKNISNNNIFSKFSYNSSNFPISIENLDYFNNPVNAVPRTCSIILKINSSINCNNFINVIKNIIEQNDYDIDIYKIDDTNIKLTSYGVSSHSAHPEDGINSISRLIILLDNLFKTYKINYPLFDYFCKYIGNDFSGTKMNLNLQDESGALTLVPSQIYIKDDKVFITVNIRIPVSIDFDTIIEKFNELFDKDNINILNIRKPLYIDKNDKLVKLLCKVFNNSCSRTFEPLAIGGATYARAFDNFVSFGMNFPGDKDMCHKADEFVDIDKLIFSANIYAKAIYELLNC